MFGVETAGIDLYRARGHQIVRLEGEDGHSLKQNLHMQENGSQMKRGQNPLYLMPRDWGAEVTRVGRERPIQEEEKAAAPECACRGACAGLRQQERELAVGRAAAAPEVELARPPSPPNAVMNQLMVFLDV